MSFSRVVHLFGAPSLFKAPLLFGLFFSAALTPACKEQALPASDDDEDGGKGLGGEGSDPRAPLRGPATDVRCDFDAECSDGVFCNGQESCYEGRCYLGVEPRCDDGIDCTTDSCSHLENGCKFEAPDLDGDGHLDASCEGPDGESLGDDCDDEDADRYPGHFEVCTEQDPAHDEDCDPTTFGHLDADLDGFVSAACCNEDGDGDFVCGDDCDDESFRRYPNHPEICDEIDNDCDGLVDVNTKEVPWYPDEDGDNYGAVGAEGQKSCFPIDGYSLRDTDCDDGTAAVHTAAFELCDGVDNDCDGQVDEGGVCACAPDGNARACACEGTDTGVQVCAGGLWGACDCSECIEGTVDCLGDLLPRSCENGRYKIGSACRGVRPLCLEGECVCDDGTQNCQELDDVVPPVIVATSPAALADNVQPSAVMAVVFSEPMSTLSFGLGSLKVEDLLGTEVPGAISVGGTTVVFTPSSPLTPGTHYVFSVAAGVEDVAGNSLQDAIANAFSVAPSAVSESVSAGASAAYTSPLLATSSGGEALVLARKNDLSGPAPVYVGYVPLTFTGAGFTDGDSLFQDDAMNSLAVDDDGNAFLLHKPSDTVERYDFDGADWLGPVEITTTDNSPDYPLVSCAASGTCFTSVISVGTLAIDRWVNGSYIMPKAAPTNNILSRRESAINSAGSAAVVYVEAGSLFAHRSTFNLDIWSQGERTGLASPVDDVAVAVAPDGTALVAYVREESGFSQLFLEEVSQIAVFSGTAAEPSPLVSERFEHSPKVGFDSTGIAHVTYLVDDTALMTMRRGVDGLFTLEKAVSQPLGSIVAHKLAVSENGDAVVVYLQHIGKRRRLVGARYSPSTGWGQPEILDDRSDAIENFEVGIFGDGQALVVYQQGSLWWRMF